MDASSHHEAAPLEVNQVEPTTNTTTSTSRIERHSAELPNGSESEESNSSDNDNDDPVDHNSKAAARLYHASRQTVAELEAKAQGKTLSRASSSGTSTNETQPGAVAMYRSESQNETSCSAAAEAEGAEEVPMIHAELAEDHHEHQEPTMVIQAHLAEDPPPVAVRIHEAELVTAPPPPEAMQVHFDEEAPPDPRAHPAAQNGAPEYLPPTKLKKFWSQHGKPFVRFQLLLLVIGLVAAIVIPRIHKDKEAQEMQDKLKTLEDFFGEDLQLAFEGPTGAPTPAPSTRPVKDCYDSTLKIAQAQIQDPHKEIFILCPNVLIPLGNLTDDHKIEGGDYPLTAIGNNVEFRCWLDGRRDNHCVLDGGFLQVLLQPSLPDDLAGESVNRTDHVVFRGITFTGTLTEGPGMIGGTSVMVNNPGQAISFIDCAWENIVAPKGIAQIGDSRDNLSFAPTTDVIFEDCTFSNIVYDGPLFGVYGQRLSLRQSSFEGISLPPIIEPCSVHESLEWCQGLLYCFGRSVCELEDVCVDGLDYAGPAAVVVASHGTELNVDGGKYNAGLKLHRSVVSTASNTSCSTGMAQFTEPRYQGLECLQPLANWTESDHCML